MNPIQKKQNPFSKKEIPQNDPSSDPMAKAGNFSNFEISASTIQTLKRNNFHYLFPIQQKTYKHVFAKKDIIGRDRTGSGKTLAFALPTLERLREEKRLSGKRGQLPFVLVILPTRELAIQVTREFEKLSNNNREFRVMSIYGGTSVDDQIHKLRSGVEVVVGTPGRLMDLQDRGKLILSDLQTIVLDETDQMLNFGFQEDIEEILDGVKHDLKDVDRTLEDVQFLLFSATVPRWVEKIAMRFMKKDLVRVDMVKNSTIKTSTTVSHLCMNFPSKDQKIKAIGDIVKLYGGDHCRTIVFTDTKDEANNILLNGQLKMDLQVLHGDIPQNQREVTFKSFRNGKLRCLVATNVAARGLDIPEVDLIIQLSPPKEIDAYIHRSGRTGRAGKSGTCITFYTSWERELIGRIEYKVGVKLAKVGVPQPEDLIKASARDIGLSFDDVSPDVLEFFKDSVKDILEHYSPEEALGRALAIMSGYTKKVKQRSLLSSTEGYVTYVLETDDEVRSMQYVWTILKRNFSANICDSIKKMVFLRNRRGVVFDISEKNKKTFDDIIEELDERGLDVYAAKVLPEIEERQSSSNMNRRGEKYNSYNNDRRNNNGGYRNNNSNRDFGRNNNKRDYNNSNNNRRNYDNDNNSNRRNNDDGNNRNKGGRGRGGFGFSGGGKMISDVDYKKLFVTNLGNNLDADLKKLVESLGFKPSNVFVVKTSDGKGKGLGYVNFQREDLAEEAMDVLNGEDLNGKKIRVTFAMRK